MTMFAHTIYTWLLANLFVPVSYFLTELIISQRMPHGFLSNAGLIGDFLLVFVVSFLVSMPCLFLGRFLLGIIVLSNYTKEAQLLLWFVGTGLLVIGEAFVAGLLFNEKTNYQFILIFMPCVAATWVAIAIRYRQFNQLIHSLKTNE